MVEVSYNLVSALVAFSMQYDDFMHAVSRETSLVGHAHAEGRIIDNLRGRPQTQAQLRKVMRIERGQLSRAVKNLLAKGFIEPASQSPGSWPAYGLTARGWRRYNDTKQARFNAIGTAVSKMLRPEMRS